MRRVGFLISVVGVFLFGFACSQPPHRELNDKSEVQVDFEFVGKAGPTNAYSIELKAIPNGSRLPNGYQLIPDKTYYITTEAIDFGDAIVSFKVPAKSEDEFRRVKVLDLVASELDPSGYEWQDCTVSDKEWLYRRTARPSKSSEDRIFKFLPSFQTKQISCAPDRLEEQNYFAVVLESVAASNGVSSPITVRLDRVEEPTNGDERLYVVSFTNTGQKTLKQINFYSTFDADTKLVSFGPSQGECRRTKFGSSYGSVVCFLGQLEPSTTATLQLRGSPVPAAVVPGSTTINRGWVVSGVAKEDANDPSTEANSFDIQLLKR